MSYIYGSGQLTVETATATNTFAHRWKDCFGGPDDLEILELVWTGNGLRWIDGEILSYITDLKIPEVSCVGLGKADNLYFVPKIYLIGKFKVQPIQLEGIFSVGAGNVVQPTASTTTPPLQQDFIQQQLDYFATLHRGNGYMPDPNSWVERIENEIKADDETPYVVE